MKQFSKQQIKEKVDELEHWENYKPMNMASSMGRKAQINNLKATIREMVPLEVIREWVND